MSLIRFFSLMLVLATLAFAAESNAQTSQTRCVGNQTSFWNNCLGEKRYPAGGRYVGEWRNGKLHGHGTYHYANGDKYVGQWKFSNKNGKGAYTTELGGRYEGEWLESEYHGHGTLILPDSYADHVPASARLYKKYVGKFEHGNFVGLGELSWDGYKYVGGFKDGNFDGYGMESDAKSGRYAGNWKVGLKHGQGTQVSNNGISYVGYWVNGTYHGKGELTWPDGRKYVGEWKDGKKDGQGTFIWPNGAKYFGRWKGTLRNGQGTYTWPDGRKYVGEWKDNKYNGRGVIYAANGAILEQGIYEKGKLINPIQTQVAKVEDRFAPLNDKGVCNLATHKLSDRLRTFDTRSEWAGHVAEAKRRGLTLSDCTRLLGDKPARQQQVANNSNLRKCPSSGVRNNCFGTYTWPDGQKFVGEFKDGKRNGQGTYTWPNGHKYVGEYKDDKWHGQGTLTWPNGAKYVGEFRGGKRNGQGTFTWPNGDKYVGYWKDSKKHDQGTRYAANGAILEQGIYRNGVLVNKSTIQQPETVNAKFESLSDKVICVYATNKSDGIRRYENNPIYRSHIAELKNRSLSVADCSRLLGDNGVFVGPTLAQSKLKKCPESISVLWNNCFGTYTYLDGGKYVGEWKDNKFNGQGTYTYLDGTKYVGEWKDGQSNGQGTRYASDGSIYEQGIYEKGRLVKNFAKQQQKETPIWLRDLIRSKSSVTLCRLATTISDGQRHFDPSFPKHFRELKRRNTKLADCSRLLGDNRALEDTRNALSKYCPAARIRVGTESYRVYKGKDRTNPDNVRYQATLTKVARECVYSGDQLEIKVGALGRVITGPSGNAGSFNMPIRVDVQEGGCSRHFKIHKQPASVPEGTTNSSFQFVDNTIVIPAPKATNVRIYLGFDETPNAKSSAKPCT